MGPQLRTLIAWDSGPVWYHRRSGTPANSYDNGRIRSRRSKVWTAPRSSRSNSFEPIADRPGLDSPKVCGIEPSQ